MRKAIILGSLAALGVSGPVLAQDALSYSYFELGYINSENGGLDGNGPNLFGTFALTEMAHLFGSYSDQDLDFGIGVKFLQLGGGLNFSLSDTVDLVTRLSLVEVEVDGPNFSNDDDGYALGVFLRTRAAEKFDLTAGLNYQDLDNGGEDTAITAGLRYYLTTRIAAGIDLLQNDDDTTYILSGRYDISY